MNDQLTAKIKPETKNEPRLDSTTIQSNSEEVNSLAQSSRWLIYTRAYAYRYGAGLAFGLHNRTAPVAPAPTREIYLDSTLSKYKGVGKIKVEVWSPPRIAVGTRPAVINFHGGGFMLGAGTDDARWAAVVMRAVDAVVFTVNYRLAPGYPFPTPIEDCVDAILQITARAAEFGVDPSRICLSGFSAGGNCALASWVVLQDPTRWDYNFTTEPPKIAGITMFYPVLDWTDGRQAKRQLCARPELTLAPSLTDLIDISYMYPEMDRNKRRDLRLSPGLMPDEMLLALPPVHQCLCEHDMLLQEGLAFTKRLQAHGKTVSERVVKGEKHAWDKPPPMTFKNSAAIEYGEATFAMAKWLGQDYDTDKDSVSSMPTRRLKIPTPSRLSLRSRSR